MGKMFVSFNGTKQQFIDKGYASSYSDKIVFIKGDENGLGKCIFTKGKYYSDIDSYISGIEVGGQTYAANGGAPLAFGINGDGLNVSLSGDNKTVVFELDKDVVATVSALTSVEDKFDGKFDELGDAAYKNVTNTFVEGSQDLPSCKAVSSKVQSGVEYVMRTLNGVISEKADQTDLETVSGIAEENKTNIQTITGNLNSVSAIAYGHITEIADLEGSISVVQEDLKSYTPLVDFNKLRGEFDTLVSGDTSSVIESFNEVVKFLEGNTDEETLQGALAGKQNTIEDLETIRTNAQLGATAHGWGNHADAGYALQSTVEENERVTSEALNDLKESIEGLGDAAYKDVATAVTSSDENLVTSNAVYGELQNYLRNGYDGVDFEINSKFGIRTGNNNPLTLTNVNDTNVRINFNAKKPEGTEGFVGALGIKDLNPTFTDIEGITHTLLLEDKTSTLYYTKQEVDAMWEWEELN